MAISQFFEKCEPALKFTQMLKSLFKWFIKKILQVFLKYNLVFIFL
jgi:hypothetical protein